MKILVYGGGAVGLGLAGFLIQAGEDVDVLARETTCELLRKSGLSRTGYFGKFHAEPSGLRPYESLKDIEDHEYDYILVCTKSNDTKSAADDISGNLEAISHKPLIVLCQNGWGNAEIFAARFEESLIYNARIITGFRRPVGNMVDITVHVDDIHVGSIFHDRVADVENLCKAVARGGMPCTATSTIKKDLWAKMLYNCALNPLGGLFRVPYGDLGESGHTRNIMENIIKEIFIIMKAGGYKTFWKNCDEYLPVFFSELIPKTAKHEASTLQDIKAGRKTEIDSLNGAVVKLGKKFGIEVPCNTIVYEMIKFTEQMNLKY